MNLRYSVKAVQSSIVKHQSEIEVTVPLLEVKNLHVSYGAIHALHGVDLAVEPGEIVTLIGANGAGKTTTLRAIAGMLRAGRGSITFNGQSILGLPPHEIVRMGISMAPEGRGIFANLSVAENLDIGAYSRRDRAGIQADKERMFKQLAALRSGGADQDAASR